MSPSGRTTSGKLARGMGWGPQSRSIAIGGALPPMTARRPCSSLPATGGEESAGRRCHKIPRRPNSPRRIFLAALLALFAAPVLATRAQEAPVVIGHQEHPPLLTLDPFTGNFAINALLEQDTSKAGNSSTQTTNALIQESITLATGGGVISKSFFDWHASGTLGLEEDWTQSPSLSSSGFGLLNAYNFNGNLLSASSFPANVFARRSEDYVERSFQPLAKDIVSEYGATFNYASEKLPTTLAIDHTDTTQNELGGANDYILSENRVEFSTAYDPFDGHHLSLNYTYDDASESNPDALAQGYKSQDISLAHQWQIDRAGRFVLAQSFTYGTQTGVYDTTQMHLGEQLRARWSDTFDTGATYTFDQQDFGTYLNKTNLVTAFFNHRLFESLFTNGQIGASSTARTFSGALAETGSSDSSTYFANLSTNYTKKVPLGTFTANAGVGYNQATNGAIGAPQPVLNDFETFTDPQPIIITRTGVDPSSIVLYNAAHTRRYLPNIDYTVAQVGNTIRIYRPVTSNINAGDTVLLNYNVLPLPGYSVDTDTLTLGARYDFTQGPLNGLGVFARYLQQDQSLSSSSSLLQPDNIVDTDFGVDYRFWKMTLRAEYEDYESTLDPYTAMRLSAGYSDALSRAVSLSLSANQSFINYPNVGGTSDLTTFDGRLDYQISRQLKAILTARFENTIDNRVGNTTGFEEQGELRWTIRQTQIFLILRHTDLEGSASELESFMAQFGIIRNF